MDEESITEQNTCQSTVLGKTNVFRLTFEWDQRGLLSERKGKVIPCRWTKNWKSTGTNSRSSGARLRVSETELTGRHFDVTSISHYLSPRGSSWLPSACPPAVSGTPSRPPPARDPGTNEHRSAPRDRHHGAEQPPGQPPPVAPAAAGKWGVLCWSWPWPSPAPCWVVPRTALRPREAAAPGRADLGAGPPSRPGCRTTRGYPQRIWRSRRLPDNFFR